jgi:hypothetical protein
VADRAGKRWVAAEVKKGEELARIPKAKERKGILRRRALARRRRALILHLNDPSRAEWWGLFPHYAGTFPQIIPNGLMVDPSAFAARRWLNPAPRSFFPTPSSARVGVLSGGSNKALPDGLPPFGFPRR